MRGMQMIVKQCGKALVLAALVLLFVTAPSAHGQTAEQNTYIRFVRAGVEQMKNGDYQAARDSFEDALRYNDSDGAAHLGLGMAFFHLRDDRSAERELSRAAELNPKEAVAYQFLGELSYRKDDLEDGRVLVGEGR